MSANRRVWARLRTAPSPRASSIGLAVGLVLAIPVGRRLSASHFGVSGYDAVVLGSALSVLLGAGWFGCWIPALRATRVDPLAALGAE